MAGVSTLKNFILQIAKMDNETTKIDSDAEKEILSRVMRNAKLFENLNKEESDIVSRYLLGEPIITSTAKRNTDRTVRYPKTEIDLNNVISKRMGLKHAEYYTVKYDKDGDWTEVTYFDKNDKIIATETCKYSEDKNNNKITYKSYTNLFSLSLDTDKQGKSTSILSSFKNFAINIAQFLNDLN